MLGGLAAEAQKLEHGCRILVVLGPTNILPTDISLVCSTHKNEA